MARAPRPDPAAVPTDPGDPTASDPTPVDPDPGGDADDVTPDDLTLSGDAAAAVAPTPETPSAAPDARTVIARAGLNLRSGHGTEFGILRSLAYGTRVQVLGREGPWALIDQEGDGAADGYVLASFLRDDQPGTAALAAALPSAVGTVATTGGFVPLNRSVLQTIMDRCGGIPIRSKLDLDVVSDALNRAMILAGAGTRLREVAFLSQSVIETDYFRTFSEYGKGAGKAYRPYYGRGMHQLTWKATYAACSKAVFGDERLVTNPDLIIDDIEINVKATAWYWRDYKPFNRLADAGDIDEIIHRLYGGQITSPKPAVRRSVLLRRSYYATIGAILQRIA